MLKQCGHCTRTKVLRCEGGGGLKLLHPDVYSGFDIKIVHRVFWSGLIPAVRTVFLSNTFLEMAHMHYDGVVSSWTCPYIGDLASSLRCCLLLCRKLPWPLFSSASSIFGAFSMWDIGV